MVSRERDPELSKSFRAPEAHESFCLCDALA